MFCLLSAFMDIKHQIFHVYFCYHLPGLLPHCANEFFPLMQFLLSPTMTQLHSHGRHKMDDHVVLLLGWNKSGEKRGRERCLLSHHIFLSLHFQLTLLVKGDSKVLLCIVSSFQTSILDGMR